MATQSAPPPPPPPPQSLRRRSKVFWPLLIAVNFSIGAYLYTRPNKEEREGDEPATAASATITTTNISTASVDSTSTSPLEISEPVKPIPMDQQRELLKWILEEKRKVKTKDPQEKKKIDEEKALLKRLIRGKSIPSL